MRYVEGTDLGALLADGESRLLPERAVTLIAQVAGALDEAHDRGLVRRDVKPTNVLIARRDGSRARVPHRLRADEAARGRGRADATGLRHGHRRYMAPEQVRGEIDKLDGRADVYALAMRPVQVAPPASRRSIAPATSRRWSPTCAIRCRRCATRGPTCRSQLDAAVPARAGEGPRGPARSRRARSPRPRWPRSGGRKRRPRRSRGRAGCASSSPTIPCWSARASRVLLENAGS